MMFVASTGIGIEWIAALLAAGSFLLGVIAAVAGAAWTVRSTMDSKIAAVTADLKAKFEGDLESRITTHMESEHTRDADGRTVRERLIIIETRCAERHEDGNTWRPPDGDRRKRGGGGGTP